MRTDLSHLPQDKQDEQDELRRIVGLIRDAGHKPETHALDDLERLAAAHVTGLVRVFPRATEEGRARFDLLNRAYIDARYNPEYRITHEDLAYLGARVRELKSVVEEACRKRIASLVA